MLISELSQAVGGLSEPSKMPGFSYGIPAAECAIGGILRARKGSVCSKCYARKGMYVFPVVQEAQYRRLAILEKDLFAWTGNMIHLIRKKLAKREKVFRWHDSGDLQSADHLSAIVTIARELSDVQFWLPTKEYALIRAWLLENGSFPANLIVRVSAPMLGQSALDIPGVNSSTVGTGEGFRCEAYTRGGKCGDCRACWDKNVKSVDYPLH